MEGKIYIIPVTISNFNIKMMEKMGELECYGVFSEENVIQVSFTFILIVLSTFIKRFGVFRCSDCLECSLLRVF